MWESINVLNFKNKSELRVGKYLGYILNIKVNMVFEKVYSPIFKC